ncbi:UDP-N-acetylmuramoyl-L-alanine--D-glutamate ligase [Corynebacterium timonense]|uniref:UDP-N-acetylmuramoylalanine--D-glutamate ligase n=1 Tax=Corynebacterium timonense TaxID=441500 RepID=A0A1H1ML82_9CORY|nr:UDP-N-acetylmuramoyl-L-alanine--D-glutamate ligase [Corynebacterium timonense]SDR87591.1 UDP-N-acetylmuramoylalanine--D-glutamate ligase [Corynebacterium timonense]
MGAGASVVPGNVPPELRNGVLLVGAGVSGRGAARLLSALGVGFTVADDNAENRAALGEETGAPTLGTAEAASAIGEYTTVVTSPGWRPDTPLLVAAARAGLDVLGDVELCFRLDRAGVFGAPRTWLAVTGTNGKTTTTGMLAAIMAESTHDTGLEAVACGNIGLSVSDALLAPTRADVLVAELSSFQLHWSSQLRPAAGVLLNLAEDHIDWHGSFAAYARDKAAVLRAETAVAGVDDPEVARLVRDSGREDVIGFTLSTPDDGQVGVVGEAIVARFGGDAVELASAVGIEPAGVAGVYDALAAAAVAASQGVRPERIAAGLAGYRVAGHRGAVVHAAGGVEWVDNSKATNPHAAHSALEGAGTVVWVAGGQLKGAEVGELVRAHAHQFRAVALLGADRAILREALARIAPEVPVCVCEETDPARAMEQVVDFAARHARPGDTVVLAPAAASLDMFSGMAQRGELFAAAAVRHS